jgi:hypothetical protein
MTSVLEVEFIKILCLQGLYLNVIRPSGVSTKSKLPVVVVSSVLCSSLWLIHSDSIRSGYMEAGLSSVCPHRGGADSILRWFPHG